MSGDPLLIAALLALGACGGFLAGLLGIGGGMILVPFTTVLLEANGFAHALALKVAVATSLASICFTSLSSLRAHHGHGTVRWPLVAALAPGLVLGSAAGALVAAQLPVRLLAAFFAIFVGVMATRMLRPRGTPTPRALPGAIGLLAIGVAVGAVSAWVGAGGAFMLVPFLLARQVSMHQAVGSSAALGFPIALAGGLGYVLSSPNAADQLPAGMLGFVYLPALAGLSAASVLTAPLGARAAQRMNVQQLRRVFAVMLYGIAGYMLLRALRP
ncbi:MAG TPA: sulfite exporter TauE/SafE family protein [Methylibium sp.]|uniref:sulfite exporter TauE/SafE family protein n=1 Tax=Methylibium sp. TaxID=2067992 RepID=UPI002DBD93B5|nr:sulfite exporter TauE/SafE family protein [Methylibium sp.]HEU4459884.1 sulfite exporter TauE/SafE family protein [Methylibium sp.]